MLVHRTGMYSHKNPFACDILSVGYFCTNQPGGQSVVSGNTKAYLPQLELENSTQTKKRRGINVADVVGSQKIDTGVY